MDIALLDLISTEPAYLDSIPISPGRLIAVSHEGSPTKGELYWDAEDGTRKCIGSDISEIEELLGDKADLVDGKVKKEQLPEIQTDQVVEQPDTPTSPNTILWVDTDAETPGVDLDAKLAKKADIAHTHLWGDVTEKPNVFTPAEHDHATGQIVGLNEALNGKANKSIKLSRSISPTWTGNVAPYTQTINVADVTETSIVDVSLPPTATAEQVEAFQSLNLQDGGQSIGSITLRAFGEKNTMYVPICVIVRGDI